MASETTIPVRTSYAFNSDLPVGTLYIYAANRITNLNPGLGTARPGIAVRVFRRGVWFDEMLRDFSVDAHDVYEPQTVNKLGRLGAYRSTVTPEQREAAIALATEWAQRLAATGGESDGEAVTIHV